MPSKFLWRFSYIVLAAVGWWPMTAEAALPSAEKLKQVDARCVAEADREAVAQQVATDLARRLKAANVASSAQWRTIQTRDDWLKQRAKTLQALKQSLGTWPQERAAPRWKTTSTYNGDGFQIDNLVFESRPGWWVTANLYRPAKPQASMPGLMVCHAHHTPKEHGELQDMGMTWARVGCCVLVMDQFGHGERRQHPFGTAADYEKSFRVGHADYYFRYDSALQLQLVGDSLMGWMVWDLMRGLDVLLAQPGVDPDRQILLGAVAGGGDPAAVAGALDERWDAVIPFNFGGPQPETRYPLPADAESSFHYAGSGSWESTRNLRDSASGGFLPWMIVGSIAPRRFVYSHEFHWDRERDPVWQRLQRLYEMFENPHGLAFTFGAGSVKGSTASDTHCTHIGRRHRVLIHAALRDWYGIAVTEGTEYSQRLPSETLRCWTSPAREELRPRALSEMTHARAKQLQAELRSVAGQPASNDLRRVVRQRWSKLLEASPAFGIASVAEGPTTVKTSEQLDDVRIERIVLTTESDLRVPLLLLSPSSLKSEEPVVIGLCSQGKARMLEHRSNEILAELARGRAVCLVDLRGMGESALGSSKGRRSQATSLAASAQMLSDPLLCQQWRDLQATLSFLRHTEAFKGRRFVMWGESFAPSQPPNNFKLMPRDDDSQLPPVAEPQAPLLALLAGLMHDDVETVRISPVAEWSSYLQTPLSLVAFDAVIPGVLNAGDVSDLIAAQKPAVLISK